MPVTLNSNRLRIDRSKRSAERFESSSRILSIALINNMSDGALEATERQFRALLDSASGGISVHLSLYSLPGVPRGETGARHISRFYSSVKNLPDMQLDGLIVTGREPLTPDLAEEPYWDSFTKVLDWARNHTYSTVWSCLAAHAAILYTDGIRRMKSDRKHCGVFDCVRVSDHPLTAGTPSRFKLPHSRWNGIAEEELKGCGYHVLTRADAGVDTFIKHHKSMFLFFQGHPEYESNTLMLEYRRDIGRYIKGETAIYPAMPQGYFAQDTMMALTAIQEQAMFCPREELLAEGCRILEKVNVENTWHATATCIYRNWLEYIATQKQLRSMGGNDLVSAGPVDGSIPGLVAAQGASNSAVFATCAQAPSTASTASRDTLTIL